MIYRELYMSRIRPFVGNDLIKVLTGMRRCGKSVLLDLIQREIASYGVNVGQFIYFNFENMSVSHLCSAEALHKEVSTLMKNISGKAYLFFDEIQEVAGWEKCINSFRVEYDCDIYLTGSNAKLLSGELSTYLAGRYVEFVIYPFSFKEFLELYETIFPDSDLKVVFERYLTDGGMPYLSNLRFEKAPSFQYLLDLYNSVVLKDIVKRNNIRDVDLLERIITYVASNIGTTFSSTSISRFFKNEKRIVAPETILNYIKACENAFLFYRVHRQDLQGKKILTINEKYYIVDHGIKEAVFGGNMQDINLIFENIVYMELLRRGYKITVGKAGEKEIDFIATKQDQKLYIQVAYLLANGESIQREFGAFEIIKDNFPKYVVSYDEINMSRNGIRHMNIREFLLHQDWS